MSRTLVFVGCLNRKTKRLDRANGRGIASFLMDEASGHLSPLAVTTDLSNPSFLALDAERRLLAVAWENDDWPNGLISTHAIDTKSGELSPISSRSAGGNMTCHVSLVGDQLYGSNFGIETQPGDAAHIAFSVNPNGSLSTALGILPRLEGSQAHSVVPAPDGELALAADRGLNLIRIISIPPAVGQMACSQHIVMPPGSGPRHSAFHPLGKTAYVVNEFNNTIVVLKREQTVGFSIHQIVPLLPATFSGRSTAAEILVSRDGARLLASNRGHDSIVTMRIDLDGTLSHPIWTSCGGQTPRNMALDQSERFLIVANQGSDRICVFAAGAEFEELTLLHSYELGTPMGVVIGNFD